VQSVVKNRIAVGFRQTYRSKHPTSNTPHQAHLQPFTKKNKKLSRIICKVQKNSAIFATAFRTSKATFLEKKVKNKFGLNSKGFVSLPSVQKRKGD